MTLARTLAAVALGVLLLGWPALPLVERLGADPPRPALALWILGVWALLVVLAALIARRGDD
jgi:hypothetical protein